MAYSMENQDEKMIRLANYLEVLKMESHEMERQLQTSRYRRMQREFEFSRSSAAHQTSKSNVSVTQETFAVPRNLGDLEGDIQEALMDLQGFRLARVNLEHALASS